MTEPAPLPGPSGFAEFEAAVAAAAAAGFDWNHQDAEPRFTVGFNRFEPFHLDISTPAAAGWFRKFHEGNWTIEPLTILVLETLTDMFGLTSALDIGAHFGFLSMVLLRNPALREVHAVEMNPESCNLIRAHLPRNAHLDPGQRFRLHNVGLADFDSPDTEIWYRDMRLVFEPFHRATPARIDILTLRTLIERIGHVPDLIKIDIEGFEAKLVESFEWMLERARPRVVLELHWDELLERLGATRRQVMQPFFDRGYRCARLNWHQRMPRANFMAEVTPENLDQMLATKPHAMFVLF